MHSDFWLSTHIQFHAPTVYSSEADDVLLDVVAPLVEEWQSLFPRGRFFFVRYSDEHGPHIRLRLSGTDDNAKFTLQSLLQKYGVLTSTSVQHERRSHAGLPVRCAYRWAIYEPETERYGGTPAVAVAEQLFHASSILAIQDVGETRRDKSQRLGRALVAILLALHVFAETRVEGAEFAHTYWSVHLIAFANRMSTTFRLLADEFDSRAVSTGVSQFALIERIWRELDGSPSLRRNHAAYSEALVASKARLVDLFQRRLLVRNGKEADDFSQCIHTLIVSYIHMTSNRLGITLGEEAYLGYLIDHALRAERG